MPLFPDDLRATPGRPIQPAWRALERWVDGYGISARGRNLRMTHLPDETLIFAPSGPGAWRHPFRLAVAGTVATIAPGTLNLETPRIEALPGTNETQALTLDGRDELGLETGRFPSLECLGQGHGGAGPDGRSFVCLRVLVDPVTGEAAAEAAPLAWLQIVHRRELPAGFASGGMPEILDDGWTIGLWPVGVLYWNREGNAVRRFFQVVHHNIQHRFQRGAELPEPGARGPGRHWFFGAT